VRRAIAILLLVATPAAFAADVRKIRLLNISAQSAATLISALIQHKIHRPTDALKCLGYGAASGYGFYEAKLLARRGDVQSGWIVANVAGSISENTAAGRGPIDQLGYSIGPARIRFSFVNADSYAYVDFNAYEAASLVTAYRDNDRMRYRSGMIAFERDSFYPNQNGVNGRIVGITYGIFPGVYTHTVTSTRNHEVIHAMQALQADSVDPSFRFLSYEPARATERRIIRFEFVKLGAFNLASDVVTGRQQYRNRWNEIEAYRLAQNRAP